MFEPRDKELRNSVPNFTKLSEIWLGEPAGKKLILDPGFGSRGQKNTGSGLRNGCGSNSVHRSTFLFGKDLGSIDR